MILACHAISKSFGENRIVTNGTFHIEDHEKAAVVGINGAGKTTLLKMIVGELSPDGGTIMLTKGKTLGYLSQYQELTDGSTVYEEVRSAREDILHMELRIRELEKSMRSLAGEELEQVMNTYHRLTSAFEQENGYAYESEVNGVLKGLGFLEEDYGKHVDTLSGGQKTRVALSKLLLTKPDLLLLDEPTNHLDLHSVAWLETFLSTYPGAVLIVSHDRYFLDHLATKIIEIENGSLSVYSGNYTAYAAKRQMIRDAKLKEYYNQQREIKHQEAVIEKLKSFNREKSIKRAESREKALEKITPLDKPMEVKQDMRISLEPGRVSGNDVLSVENFSKSFGELCLFSDISFEVKRGEHVALIGDNGTGKTTFLKILNLLEKQDTGSFRLGTNVEIGYYDQEHQLLHMEKSIFDEISDAYPTLTNTRIRNVLAAFLFTDDDVFKRIGDLSGGERGRVSLAKLMLSNANFLILDEPTNHLDIASKEILENALNNYSGTVLYVSHDRYFINQTASRILELTGHTFVSYIGNYDYYLEKREELTAKTLEGRGLLLPTETDTKVSDAKLSWEESKKEQAALRKKQNDLKKTEARIAELEEKIAELDDLMTKEEVYTNSVRCQEVANEKELLETELTELYERWEVLAEETDTDQPGN